jgi:hypothetical protein
MLTPNSRNCTKHHVRCDYMDSPPGIDDNLRVATHPGLNWTPEIEIAVNSWQSTGQFPFQELEIHPIPQVKNLSRNEIRLLHHVCSILNELKQSRTSKLSVWTDVMPQYVSCL